MDGLDTYGVQDPVQTATMDSLGLGSGSPSDGIDLNSIVKQLFPEKRTALNPYEALRVKIAKSQAARMEQQRKVDEQTMPYVQRDIAASDARQKDFSAKIDEALNALNAPPPQRPTGMNEGEMLAGAISGLLAPGNIDFILTHLAAVSGARNDQEFEDRLRKYGLTRDTAKMALQTLYHQADSELSYNRSLRGQEIAMRSASAQNLAEIQAQGDQQLQRVDLADIQAQQDAEAAQRKQAFDIQMAQIKAQAEAGIAQGKARESALNSAADDFRQVVASNFPAGTELTAENANDLNEQAEDLADRMFGGADTPERAAFRARLGFWQPRQASSAPGLDLQERRWNEGAPMRGLDFSIKTQQLKKLQNAPTPAVAGAQKQIAELDQKIGLARAKIRALVKSKPSNPSAAGEWSLAVGKLLSEEYHLTAKKRYLATGEYPSVDEYFPEQVKMFGLQSVAGNPKTSGGTKTGNAPVSPVAGKGGKWGPPIHP